MGHLSLYVFLFHKIKLMEVNPNSSKSGHYYWSLLSYISWPFKKKIIIKPIDPFETAWVAIGVLWVLVGI